MALSKREVEIAEAWVELEYRRCKRSCEHFIARYVQIEDVDVEGGAQRFRLWPKQVEVLALLLTARLLIVLKARQLGLTWLALSYALWRCLFRSGYKVVTLSDKEDNAKELIKRVKFMLERLPKWLVRERRQAPLGFTGVTYDWTTQLVTFFHADGANSEIKALPASEDAGRSLTGSLLIIDEHASQPFAPLIWRAAFPTINRPTGGQVVILSTGKAGTLFQRMWDGAVKAVNGFVSIFLPWWSDPRRDKAWYKATEQAMIEDGEVKAAVKQEYPARPEEAFALGGAAAFDEWDPEIHVPFGKTWYPPEGWKLYRAYDAGQQACCKWYAVDYEANVVCYREYYPRRVIDRLQAQKIRSLSVDPDGKPEVIQYTVGDTEAWSPSRDTGKSTADVFAECGVPMIQATKDRENGWRRLREYMHPMPLLDAKGQEVADAEGAPVMVARFMFTESCVNTIRAYPTFRSKKSNPDDVEAHEDDHLIDVDRYFLMSRPGAAVDEQTQIERRRKRQKALEPLNKRTGY